MSETSPLLRQEPDPRRSLHDRIVDVFQHIPSHSDIDNEGIKNHQQGLGITTSSGPDARFRLLESYNQSDPVCGERRCSHGTFSPRPGDAEGHKYLGMLNGRSGYGAVAATGTASSHFGGGGGHDDDEDLPESRTESEYLSQTKSSLSALSMNKHRKLYARLGDCLFSPRKSKILIVVRRYISYYIPLFIWISQYRWGFLRGDLIAALTIASIYIPMALSLASNLAHAPPINGLYSFVIHPFVYAILGSCPLLVVGPEAAGSLLTGAIVKTSVSQGDSGEDNGMENAMVIGITTAMTGAMILVAGITRLGFLDNVLSRPFLRGFITAIGFVIFVDQLIPELGLAAQAKEAGVSHAATVGKLSFIFQHGHKCHSLTAVVSLVSFGIIMMLRYIWCFSSLVV